MLLSKWHPQFLWGIFLRLSSILACSGQTEKWERSDIKLREQRGRFSYLAVKLSDIISELKCSKSEAQQLDSDTESESD